MTRDTTTGKTYEKRMSTLLTENSIQHISQINAGLKRNGGRHIIDLIIDNTLVSLKHQQVSGTAEEKVPFEFMKLQHAVDDYNYDGAIIVLSGDTGWTWKTYYLSQEFKNSMKILYPDVTIMSHEEFLEFHKI